MMPPLHADVFHAIADALEACAQALRQLAVTSPAPAPTVTSPAPAPSPYLPIKVFCQHYPVYTESALRSLLFHRTTNGLHTAVIAVEGKLLIDVAAFFQWIAQHKPSGHPTAGTIVPLRRTQKRTARRQTEQPPGQARQD